MAQSPLDQLLDRRTQVQGQLDDLDRQIRDLKEQRKTQLLDELRSLGFAVEDQAQKPRRRGPQSPMSDAHKRKMAEGRERARAAKRLDDEAVAAAGNR